MQNLFSVRQWQRDDLYRLFDRAGAFARGSVPQLGGMAAFVFSEPSTRTLVSFQMAAVRLGMNVCALDGDNSSLCKGESLEDTLTTLEAIGVNAVVIRTGFDWPGSLRRSFTSMALVNAGSGIWEHPTQALLDAFTLYQEFGTLTGLKIVIAGDLFHSRVARSNALLLHTAGAKVVLSGPPQWQAADLAPWADWMPWEQAREEADAIMMLRVQNERHKEAMAMSESAYLSSYGLTAAAFAGCPQHTIIMHPGPVNWGIELDPALADHPRCRIMKQVRSGVLVRMALLEECSVESRREQLVSA